LVATHPRSGTHFCINSLCLNLNDVEFSSIRGHYPSLERLILDHDEAYSCQWEKYARDDSDTIKVFKTHMTPSDISLALSNQHILNARDRRLFRRIYENSKVVYVCRDGRDTLVSWYRYMKDSGGGFPIDLPPRMAQCGFSEFLRMPNLYFPPVRAVAEADENRAKYWSAHVEAWIDREGAILCSYESLHKDFDSAIRKLAASLGMENRLLSNLQKPPFIRVAGNNIPGKAVASAKRLLMRVYHRRIRGVKHYPPSPAYSRKGIVGNWQDHFNNDDIAFFTDFAGGTMRKLAYT